MIIVTQPTLKKAFVWKMVAEYVNLRFQTIADFMQVINCDLMNTQGPRWPRVYWSEFMFVESPQNHVCITIWTKCLQYVLVHQK